MENFMSLIDGILGSLGGSSNTELDATVGANPELDVSASDVLNVSDGDGLLPNISLLGDVGAGLSAPVLVGVSASSDTSGDADVGGGGLLGGLL
jgi:hypothetical protein